jgi:hypothetical protein
MKICGHCGERQINEDGGVVDFVDTDNGDCLCESCFEDKKHQEILWKEYSDQALQNGGDFDFSMNY